MSSVNDFIKQQERFYQKQLSPFQKILLRKLEAHLGANIKPPEPKTFVKEITEIRQNRQPKNIAFITEDVGHMTGGRYYAYFMISALLEKGHTVTVYTNKEPVFKAEFDSYKKPKFTIVGTKAEDLHKIDVKADVYIGSPIQGCVVASKLGKKHNKPSYALIFDPFPMMEKYLGKKYYIGWRDLIDTLKTNDTKIISLCNTTSAYIRDWLNKKDQEIFPVYPCINSNILNQIPDQPQKDYVVFISRLVKHKNFDHVVHACAKNNIELKVISSVNAVRATKTAKLYKNKVDFNIRMSDKDKFKTILGSKGVINGSIFEGFGMYVAEAIACGVPFIGYDYPTFREIQGYSGAKNIYLAEHNNKKSLTQALRKALLENKKQPRSHFFDFEEMIEQLDFI